MLRSLDIITMVLTNILSRGKGCILLGLPALANAALYHQVIQTESGPVYGYPEFNSTFTGNLTNWKDIAVWKGIPFAADTSGEVSFPVLDVKTSLVKGMWYERVPY